MDHAVEFAALPGDDGHHEPLVADGDEFFLQDAFVAMRPEETFERFLNRSLLPFDIAADAVESYAGMVGDAAVGQDFAFEVFKQRAKIADGLRAASQPRKALGGGGERRLGVRRTVEQSEVAKISLGSRPAPSMRSL